MVLIVGLPGPQYLRQFKIDVQLIEEPRRSRSTMLALASFLGRLRALQEVVCLAVAGAR